MLALILVAVMGSRGIATQAVDGKVYVTGRPGCTVEGTAQSPVIYCAKVGAR